MFFISEFLPKYSRINFITMNNDLKRLGFVGILIDNREKCAGIVNDILSQQGEIILARTGLPNVKGNTSVITLVIDATTDQLGILTGKLGSIPGVSVKSGLAKK
jgi:putative iron-only hydrogenase system regulator